MMMTSASRDAASASSIRATASFDRFRRVDDPSDVVDRRLVRRDDESRVAAAAAQRFERGQQHRFVRGPRRAGDDRRAPIAKPLEHRTRAVDALRAEPHLIVPRVASEHDGVWPNAKLTSRSASAASIAPTTSSAAYASRSSAVAVRERRDDARDSVALTRPRRTPRAQRFARDDRPHVELGEHERRRPERVEHDARVARRVERQIVAEIDVQLARESRRARREVGVRELELRSSRCAPARGSVAPAFPRRPTARASTAAAAIGLDVSIPTRDSGREFLGAREANGETSNRYSARPPRHRAQSARGRDTRAGPESSPLRLLRLLARAARPWRARRRARREGSRLRPSST